MNTLQFLRALTAVSILSAPLLWGQSGANSKFRVGGEFGPALAVHSIVLDQNAFSGLAALHPGFNLSNAAASPGIKARLMFFAGIEGFTRITPHWGFGATMGQGNYSGSATADTTELRVLFKLSQFGVAPEFTINPGHHLTVLAGLVLGITPVSLSVTTIYSSEQWQDIIAGSTRRQSYTVTALAPLIQPYAGLNLRITETLGIKLVGGYELQNIGQGNWKLGNRKKISDSPAVNFSAFFSRIVIYTAF